MKIRDSSAIINGDSTVLEMPSGGLEIVSSDGRTLYSLNLEGGQLRIMSGSVCKHNDTFLNDKLVVLPKSINCVYINRLQLEN
jgi:hypothetical protein